MGLLWSSAAWAQAPAITGVVPLANANNASRIGGVAVTFSQALSSSSASALKVFSRQRGGLVTAASLAAVNANVLTLSPPLARPFLPGETVFSTVTTGATSAGGSLSRARVFQFTAAVGATGTGAFQLPLSNPNPAIAPSTRAVAVGDLDGDGDLDFACSYEDAGSNGFAGIRLNNGSGGFAVPATGATITLGVGYATPIDLALGDVDGDGDLDIVTANFNNNTVSIRLNDGNAHFTAPAVNPNPGVGSYVSQVALCDIDGDGDLDLLAANIAGVSVRFNNGAGSFTAPAGPAAEVATNGSANGIAAGDVDGDGDLDFVAANEFSNTVSLRLNDGAGSFMAPSSMPDIAVGVRPRAVVLGDFDADGDLDFATANINGTVSVRLNNGMGGFAAGTTPELLLGRATSSVATSDVDGDGDLDLLASDLYDEVVRVRLNDGRGNFALPNNFAGLVSVGTVPKSVVTGDVDGDGDLDLLTAAGGGVSVRLNYVPLVVSGVQPGSNALAAPRGGSVRAIFSQPLGSGAATLQVHSGLRGGLRTHSVPAAISGNALVYTPPAAQPFLPGETVQCTITAAAVPGPASLGHARVTQFTTAVGGTGIGNFLLPAVVATGTINTGTVYVTGMVSGDIDNDGDVDLLTGTQNNPVAIRLNDGRGTFTASAATLAIPSARLLTLADMDGDGDLDVLAASVDAGGYGGLSLSLNNGSGSFAAPVFTYVGGVVSSLTVGDFDGNGALDCALIAGSSGSTSIAIALNNGSGSFSIPSPSNWLGGINRYSAPSGLTLGDVDRDGDLDIVVACSQGAFDDGIGTYLNDGFGTFTASASYIVWFRPGEVVLGDLDGDGDLDLVTSWGGSTGVFLNDGSGRYTAQPNNTTLNYSDLVKLSLGDVDADGDLDLLLLLYTPRYTTNNGVVIVRFNDGAGNFKVSSSAGLPASVQVDKYPSSLTMTDVDGDGDLDVLTAGGIDVFYGGNAGTVSVRLNGGTVLATASARSLPRLSLYPNPATRSVWVSGAAIGQPIEVFDALGRWVAGTAPVASGATPVSLPVGLVAGVYVVRSGTQMQRLVVE